MWLIRYLAQLTLIKRWLWCYLIWYMVVLQRYFEADLRLWLTSLGIAFVVGMANNLNALASIKSGKTDLWMVIRFFLAPFCVSSFAAMVKGHGFILVFPPSWFEIALFMLPCLLFWGLCAIARTWCASTINDGRG